MDSECHEREREKDRKERQKEQEKREDVESTTREGKKEAEDTHILSTHISIGRTTAARFKSPSSTFQSSYFFVRFGERSSGREGLTKEREKVI